MLFFSSCFWHIIYETAYTCFIHYAREHLIPRKSVQIYVLSKEAYIKMQQILLILNECHWSTLFCFLTDSVGFQSLSD